VHGARVMLASTSGRSGDASLKFEGRAAPLDVCAGDRAQFGSERPRRKRPGRCGSSPSRVADCGNAFSACPPVSIVATHVVRSSVERLGRCARAFVTRPGRRDFPQSAASLAFRTAEHRRRIAETSRSWCRSTSLETGTRAAAPARRRVRRSRCPRVARGMAAGIARGEGEAGVGLFRRLQRHKRCRDCWSSWPPPASEFSANSAFAEQRAVVGEQSASSSRRWFPHRRRTR
jgi:hypothetical protein